MRLTCSSSGGDSVLSENDRSRSEENSSESHIGNRRLVVLYSRIDVSRLACKNTQETSFCRLYLQVLHRKPRTRNRLAMDIGVLNCSAEPADSMGTPENTEISSKAGLIVQWVAGWHLAVDAMWVALYRKGNFCWSTFLFGIPPGE